MSKKLKKSVPELRFSEFKGDWNLNKLRNISSLSSGATPLRSNISYFENATIPWVKTTDLNNSEILKTEECISEIAIKETSARKNPVGSVLIAMYGGFNQIGRTGLLRIEAATNQAITVVFPKPVIESSFLQHFLNRNVDEWRSFAASSRKDPNITSKDIGNFLVVFPSIAEQAKIASFLGSIDTRLTQLRRKHELLETYKRGVISEIFPHKIGKRKKNKLPNLRFANFTGDWQPKKLEEVIVKRNSIASEHVPLYSLTIENGVTEKTARYERSFLVKDENEAYKLVETNDFVYNPMNVRLGALARHKKSHCVKVSKYYDVFSLNEFVDIYFVEFLLKSYNSVQYYDHMAAGSLIEKKRLHFVDFLELIFLFPSVEEQEKIVMFITAIDKKIEAVAQQIDQAEQFKKGLLQKIFV